VKSSAFKCSRIRGLRAKFDTPRPSFFGAPLSRGDAQDASHPLSKPHHCLRGKVNAKGVFLSPLESYKNEIQVIKSGYPVFLWLKVDILSYCLDFCLMDYFCLSIWSLAVTI